MLRYEYIKENDESLKKISSGLSGHIYKMDDGRIAKFINAYSTYIYNIMDINLEMKLRSTEVLDGIDGVVTPISLIIDDGRCIGYTMEYKNGATFDKYTDNFDKKDYMNLKKYIEIHKKLSEIVKKSNDAGVIFPDLLTCDNIIVDGDNNVSLIDIDGAQVLEYPAINISSALGDSSKYCSNPKYYNRKKRLFTSEIDKKSLTYLFFLDVFGADLNKIGKYYPMIHSQITLDDYFFLYGFKDEKLQESIRKNLSSSKKGDYLDELYDELSSKYSLDICSNGKKHYKILTKNKQQ